MPYYAVARGRKIGIYESWKECSKNVVDFPYARFKKFATEAEAKVFLQENNLTRPVVDRREASNRKEDNGEASGSQLHSGGRSSPTLLEMKVSMTRLQEELSQLQTRFEEYIESRGITLPTEPLHPSPVPAQKRKHECVSENEAEDMEVSQLSFKKRNISVKDVDKSNFHVDSEGFLVVYTDGACSSNGRKGAKAGVGVYFGRDNPLNLSAPVKGRATNNMAEIQAATYALELAHDSGFSKVAVHTDSQFMINCVASWMKNWKKNNWMKADGEPVKNKEELIALDRTMEGLAVKWVHVKGHAGHEGNEEADRLAREGAKLYKESKGWARHHY